MQTAHRTPAASNVQTAKDAAVNVASTTSSSRASTDHAADWPNVGAFSAPQQQLTPKELRVTGSIPAYAAGTLYRTGPGHWQVEDTPKGTFKMDHWFDGFTHVHRFQIASQPGPDGGSSTSVTYNSRCVAEGLIKQIKKTGKHPSYTFGQRKDPCESLYAKLKSTFAASKDDDAFDNTGVTLGLDLPGFTVKGRDQSVLVTTTDSNRFKMIDPETLEPLGVAKQTTLHPDLKGPFAAAHAGRDPVTGDVFNFNLVVGPSCTYRIFKTAAATGATTILATIAAPPVYMHSLFLTEDFVILCLWPLRFAAKGAKMLWTRDIIEAFEPWDKSSQVEWWVIDRRHGRGRVATFTSAAAFAFHTINAWQTDATDGTVDIVCELSEFDNNDILTKLYYQNLVSNEAGAATYIGSGPQLASTFPHITRYRLAGVPTKGSAPSKKAVAAAQVFRLDPTKGGDLPIINSAYATRPHRYVYSVLGSGQSSFVEAICKTDVTQQTAKHWQTAKHTPGEPIFVANPAGSGAEDDGVLLSVVLNGVTGTSYLLCLDARTMTELGRADCEQPVGMGFHGKHYPAHKA